jgi:hypothetical protein
MRPPERPTIATWPRTSQITTSPYLNTGVQYGPKSRRCRSVSGMAIQDWRAGSGLGRRLDHGLSRTFRW